MDSSLLSMEALLPLTLNVPIAIFPKKRMVDDLYRQQLLECAKAQKLPEKYLLELAAQLPTKEGEQPARVEQQTKPLPVVPNQVAQQPIHALPQPITNATSQKWLMAFALYIVAILLATLGIPWLVLLYSS